MASASGPQRTRCAGVHAASPASSSSAWLGRRAASGVALRRRVDRREREERRRLVLAGHHRLEPRDDVGVPRGDVPRLADVAREIEELEPRRARLREALADAGPVADANHLLAAVARELAIEPGPRLLRAAEQRRREAHAVHARRRLRLRPDQLEQRRQPVLETRHAIAGRAGRDAALPAHDRRHAQAALVERALPAAKGPRRAEEGGVGAADVEGRAVVRGEDDDRALLEPELGEEIEDPPDLAVEARHHRSVRRPRRRVRQVLLVAEVRRFGEAAAVRGERVLGHLQREVRHGRRQEDEERPRAVHADEVAAARPDDVGRVDVAREGSVARWVERIGARSQLLVRRALGVAEHDAPAVVVEVGRVVAVRLALAVVAEEVVEALLQRVALRPGRPEPPLAHRAGRVAERLQDLGNRQLRARQRPLPFRLKLAVVADRGVSGMPSRQQHPARGRADGVARVVLREAHAARGERVERRRLDLLLPVAAELAPAEVVGQDEDDVGRRRGALRQRRRGSHEREGSWRTPAPPPAPRATRPPSMAS